MMDNQRFQTQHKTHAPAETHRYVHAKRDESMNRILEQFPFLQTCFKKYLSWLDKQDPDKIEDSDLIIALKNGEIERLKRLEAFLLDAKTILSISETDFCNKFGFKKDLLSPDPEKIHDILAEPLIVIDLDKHGFSNIEKLPNFIKMGEKKLKAADFIAVLSDRKYAVELKTIRVENNPKPTPGVPTGNSLIPSWWRIMFRNNVITKIEDKDKRVIKQLATTKEILNCDATMLVLYTRRLGPSTLMENNDFVEEVSAITVDYPEIDAFMIKEYFGNVNFYPELKSLT